MSHIDCRKIAEEIFMANKHNQQVETFSSRIEGFDMKAAYQAAGYLHECRLSSGNKPIGRKIGFTNTGLWEVFGVNQPIWSYVYDSTVHYAKSGVVDLSLANFSETKIEPELVVHFSKAPSLGAQFDEIITCIDWVASGFEIVQSHFKDWQFTAEDTVVDSGLHAALIVGPPVLIKDSGMALVKRLDELVVNLECNGKHIDQGSGSNVLGHPINALEHLLNLLCEHPDMPPIQDGEVITTGTLTSVPAITSGETWSMNFVDDSIPSLSVKFR